MKIYIDESGSFAITESTKPSISCVGALVLPHCYYPKIMLRYEKIRENFPKENGKVKGRLLKESQIAQIVELLRRSNALYEFNAVDISIESLKDLENHKNQLLPLIKVQDIVSENIRNTLVELQKILSNLALPQYIQFNLQTDLIHRLFHHMTLYYSQRDPKELGKFQWIIDAKQKEQLINGEKWWKETLKPFLVSRSIQDPMPILPIGDYSYFDEFRTLLPKITVNAQHSEEGTNLNKIFSDFIFDAKINFGLELVDILTNAVRRALMNNLQQEGWESISNLIIPDKKQNRVHLIYFSKEKPSQIRPYTDVVKRWNAAGKSLFTKKIRNL